MLKEVAEVYDDAILDHAIAPYGLSRKQWEAEVACFLRLCEITTYAYLYCTWD